MSALSSQQNVTQNLTEQQQETLPSKDYLLPPDDLDTLWFHDDPRSFFSLKLRKHIEDYDEHLKNTEGASINQFDEFNNYYEQPELNWISDYFINNLIFCKRDLDWTDNTKMCELLQLLWELLDWKNKEARNVKEQYNIKMQFLREGLQRMHGEKVVNREEVKSILDYTRRTYFRHFHLYNYCIQNKQQQVDKPVTIFTPIPTQAVGNLSIEACKEIVEPKTEDDQKEEDQEGEPGEKKEGEEEEEDPLDPNDPLYGLEQRLKNLELDDESKRIIKEKLEEASQKMKNQLEERQKNLDTKLGEKGGPPKKK